MQPLLVTPAQAAKMLGISRPTLYDLMNRLAIR